MKFKIVLFWMFFVFSNSGIAQDVLPFVENFSKSNYLGDNQIWNVTQGNDYALYFANNHYFLRYNGVNWEKYTLPNKTIIRSVFAFNDKIYSGSYNEFGYWTRKNGKMIYLSLSQDKNLFKGTLNNEEIWKIFEHNGLIYFQSFNELFVYDGKTIKNLHFPHQISYCFLVDNQIFVASIDNGVFILENNRFINQNKYDILKNTIIHAIEKQNGKTYFFTKKNGVFIEENGLLTPFKFPLNTVFKSEIINTARFISKSKVAIGTAFNGLYLVNIETGEFSNINRKNSLLNNSVLSIGFDQEMDLWLGMDNGISHVEINSPYSIFSDNTGLLGSVYAISPTKNGYLLGSNHGVFDYQNKKLSFVEGTQGQVWQINMLSATQIIGHNDGTFKYQNGKLSKVSSVNGGWMLLKNNYSNHYFQANYSGIEIYDGTNFEKHKKVTGLTKPIRNLAQNKKNELWAVDSYKSLYQIIFDDELNTKKVSNITALNGFKDDFNVKLFTFKDEILFYINRSWYKFNAITSKLDIFPLFDTEFKAISDIIPIDDSQFLIVKEGLFYLIHYENQSFYWELLPKKYYEGKIVNEDTKVVKIGSKLLINLDDGFFTYTPNQLVVSNYTIEIEGYFNNELILEDTKIPHNQSVVIRISCPFFGYKEKNLFYKLNNESTYVPIIDGEIILNNLENGNQEIEVFYLVKNKYKTLKKYNFTVLKPWYFSFWMVLLYFLIISLAFFLYYKWNKIRYLEKIKLKEEELKHQKQIIQLEMDAENKLKLQEYEKHILEMQVQTKASEVAGKSLSIAKQTEMIENIQHILENEKSIAAVKSQIHKVIKINSLNKNEWKSFESNLFKSNEDFIKILTATYKNLTSKDIKLCIYLKMNLSSKEIAPLLNISYRGVELHRYRLRKKLAIEQEVNLNLFMNTLK